MRLGLDPSKLDCTTTPGWCEGNHYLKQNADGETVWLKAFSSLRGGIRFVHGWVPPNLSEADYANVVARYGSEDNYRKGKGGAIGC